MGTHHDRRYWKKKGISDIAYLEKVVIQYRQGKSISNYLSGYKNDAIELSFMAELSPDQISKNRSQCLYWAFAKPLLSIAEYILDSCWAIVEHFAKNFLSHSWAHAKYFIWVIWYWPN